ncbi:MULTISPECIES: pantetheine-phosphate adenylyltransferase [Ligilactobacillus]|uniref:Phosphopantetheine adenylyltransferase n=1 Tax=Ligilactobacillus animalis TaxID=1605 RepID=A0AAJ6FZH6_9LACO|nr:pantetheine-phosphate adenylyltransferase [Ligilactobacillus animalis]KDA45433.1 pantetheine-phosphate adenylyltransferase, coaD [Ligilactobacillus animalis]KRM57787.1 pantetheine-phosphate adenylyltransferase [Ligilactobacillus animalis KCTC 3501 = DSM 20602]MCI5941083.1 pantetheine-phosphate adenylyltransferase [Ligilactobacillus animalis]MDO5883208.1 pantetheine-phosphate adenylyltransferase [Ligilactobacillus animalis]MDQ2233899.1 pantetheine-phosphate adenylyltransferase [Ligilactobaci
MKAIFPGSFDPVTNGHLDIIKRSAAIFDEVFVVVLTNTAKKPMFSANERQSFIQKATEKIPNVKVLAKEADLTVNVAQELDAQIIIRSVRNTQDLEFEQNIAAMNKELAPKIETLILLTDPKYAFLSSTLVKEVARFKGELGNLVPPIVQVALSKK